MKNNARIAKPMLSGLFVVLAALSAALLAPSVGPADTACAADITITVDTPADDNNLTACTPAPVDCSLRGAITKANGDAANHYTINVPADSFVLAVAGAYENGNATGDLDITRDMTIVGAGSETTIIDANGIDRVLHVHERVGVTIQNLRITGGRLDGDDGGGIYNYQGQVTLADVHVISNTAGRGGGIYNFWLAGTGTPTATITATAGSTVQNNTAGGDGGGIYNQGGRVTLTGIQVISNTAMNVGGGVLNDLGQAALAGVQVNFNTAHVGGGLFINSGQAALTDVQVVANTATETGGGGIFNSAGAETTLSGVQVVANSANTDGGGILNHGRVTLFGGQVLSNKASTGGGVFTSGQATLASVQVISNSANNGGGIFVESGELTANANCIVRNSDTALHLGSANASATGNWWGAANGPSGAAPGNGDSVSGGIDYSGFLTEPILDCPVLQTDLAITNDVTSPTAGPGQAITYTLTYTNDGPDFAHNAIIADSVPLPVLAPRYATTGATVTHWLGTTYVFTVPNLAPGEGGVIVISGTVTDSVAAAGSGFTSTVTITATTDAIAANNKASVAVRPYHSVLCLPLIERRYTIYIPPGAYPANRCAEKQLYIRGVLAGLLKECVPDVVVKADGYMQFNYTWTLDYAAGVDDVIKRSDAENRNMYVTDNRGNRYDHVDVGGAAATWSLMVDDVPLEGWFLFIPAQKDAGTFAFHDADQGFVLDNIRLVP